MNDKKQKKLAELRQAIWEAHQFCTIEELDNYIQAVLREIQADDPE